MSDLAARKKRHIVISIALGVAFLALILLLMKGLQFDQSKIPPQLIGKQAFPFKASWITGKEHLPGAANLGFTLKDLKGKPVVLNFWASWCVSCRHEAKELERFWQEHKEDVYVVGIAIQDETDSALQFAKYYGKTYILGLDADDKAAIEYGVTGVPETFYLDRTGKIVHKEIGPVTVSMLEEQLQKIL